VAFFFVFPSRSVLANNISVSKAGLISKNAGAHTVQVQFDISWENSWYDAINYDAAWVFVKYCTSNCSTTGTWLHATMKTAGTNPSGVNRGSGTSIDVIVSADKKGAFLQRSGTGSGTLSATGVQLVWDYNADGVSDADADGVNARVKVFAVEMVYVPEGSFFAGDGNEVSALSPATAGFKQGNNCRDPWSITSENSISVTNQGPCSPPTYYYTTASNAGEDASGSVFSIGASYPKGYAAFYMMKYEMSQGQYVDFLNSLTRAQQSARVGSTITSDTIGNYYVMNNQTYVSYQNGIRAPASGNGTTNPVVFGCDGNATGVIDGADSGKWHAMTQILWPDIAAYADWAGLRPLSELEFEKAARGAGVTPVNLEYAWGAASRTTATQYLALGYINESALPLSANCTNSIGMRCGIFADPTDTTRSQSGAGYYGALDLTASGYEPVVTVGNATGRGFTGSHGDGLLSVSGNAAGNSDWPGYAAGEVTGVTGTGYRGGYAGTVNSTNGPISYRGYGAKDIVTSRTTGNFMAARCGRTASA
jgi:formylglycine-generating enzyme required for sulfatase activity